MGGGDGEGAVGGVEDGGEDDAGFVAQQGRSASWAGYVDRGSYGGGA